MSEKNAHLTFWKNDLFLIWDSLFTNNHIQNKHKPQTTNHKTRQNKNKARCFTNSDMFRISKIVSRCDECLVFQEFFHPNISTVVAIQHRCIECC